jgi:DNA (cytosine-5)-methyltransferase 1
VAGLRGSGANITEIFSNQRTNGQNNFQVIQIGQRNRDTRQNLNQYRVYSPNGIAPTLNKMEGGGREPMIGIKVIGNTRKKKDYGEDKERVLSVDGISPTLNSSDYKEPLKVAIPVLTPEREKKRQMGRRFKENGEPAFTLTALDRHGVCVGVDIDTKDESHPSIYIKISEDCIGYATWYQKENCYVVVRKITPKESFRLQGFPDEMFERAQFVNSDSQLYKQAGNSVTVPIIKGIATNIN